MGNANGPAPCGAVGVKAMVSISEARYCAGFFGAIEGFAAGAADFGFQNPGLDLIQSSLT